MTIPPTEARHHRRHRLAPVLGTPGTGPPSTPPTPPLRRRHRAGPPGPSCHLPHGQPGIRAPKATAGGGGPRRGLPWRTPNTSAAPSACSAGAGVGDHERLRTAALPPASGMVQIGRCTVRRILANDHLRRWRCRRVILDPCQDLERRVAGLREMPVWSPLPRSRHDPSRASAADSWRHGRDTCDGPGRGVGNPPRG